MTKYMPLISFAVAFAIGGAWMLTKPTERTSGTTAEELPLLPGAAMAQEAGEATAVEIVEMTLGDPDAPVTVIEYASFTCPHCANFHANQFQQLEPTYIETGLVNFIYRDVYFDRFGLWAAMVARCDADRFFGIADILYTTQRQWIGDGSDPAAIAANLRTIGLSAGLEAEQLDACLSDGDTAQALVEWYQANAEADEVNSTPTLFVDGTKYSNMSYEDLAEIINAQLEAAGVPAPVN